MITPTVTGPIAKGLANLAMALLCTAKKRHTSDFPQRATGWVILVPGDFANILAKVRSEER
jgi:type IV secretory pathway VirB2 component (pilin)